MGAEIPTEIILALHHRDLYDVTGMHDSLQPCNITLML